jgi:hypothetical protein
MVPLLLYSTAIGATANSCQLLWARSLPHPCAPQSLIKFAQMARIAAKASTVASLDWLVWRVAIMHDDTMPRGCRSAELHEHNLDPTCTLSPTNHTYLPCENYLPILSDPV